MKLNRAEILNYYKRYKQLTDILYNVNNKLKLYDTDMEFAEALMSIPVENRYAWLHDKTMQALMKKGASVKDLNEATRYLQKINEVFK